MLAFIISQFSKKVKGDLSKQIALCYSNLSPLRSKDFILGEDFIRHRRIYSVKDGFISGQLINYAHHHFLMAKFTRTPMMELNTIPPKALMYQGFWGCCILFYFIGTVPLEQITSVAGTL